MGFRVSLTSVVAYCTVQRCHAHCLQYNFRVSQKQLVLRFRAYDCNLEISHTTVNMLPFLILLHSLVLVGGQYYEPQLSWYSTDTNINLIAPNKLDPSRLKNRRVAVVMDGKRAQGFQISRQCATLFWLLFSTKFAFSTPAFFTNSAKLISDSAPNNITEHLVQRNLVK